MAVLTSLKCLGPSPDFTTATDGEVRCLNQLRRIESFLATHFDFDRNNSCNGIEWSTQRYFIYRRKLIFIIPLYRDEVAEARELMETDLVLMAYLEVQQPKFRLELLFKNDGGFVDAAFELSYRAEMISVFSAALVGTLLCEGV